MDAFFSGVQDNGFDFDAFKRVAIEEYGLESGMSSARQVRGRLAGLRWLKGFFKARPADRAGFLLWWDCFELLSPAAAHLNASSTRLLSSIESDMDEYFRVAAHDASHGGGDHSSAEEHGEREERKNDEQEEDEVKGEITDFGQESGEDD